MAQRRQQQRCEAAKIVLLCGITVFCRYLAASQGPAGLRTATCDDRLHERHGRYLQRDKVQDN
jgi:hypothetical protein